MNRRIYYLAGLALLAATALVMVRANRSLLAPVLDGGKTGGSPSPGERSTAMGSGDSLLPKEYAFFLTRSPFGGGRGQGRAGRGGPEALFIFRGAVQAGTSMTAFIENVTAKSVMQVAVGDSVARGRVKSIDLDAIEYQAAGNATRIEVGQNLNGEAAPPTTAPSNVPAANKAPAQNGPASPSPQTRPASDGQP